MRAGENNTHIAFVIVVIFGLYLISMFIERKDYLTASHDSKEYQLVQNLRDELRNSPQNWNVIDFNIDENANTIHCHNGKGLQHKNKNVALCAINRFSYSLIRKEIHIMINHKTFKVMTNMDKEIGSIIAKIITEQEQKEKTERIEKEKTTIRKNLSF